MAHAALHSAKDAKSPVVGPQFGYSGSLFTTASRGRQTPHGNVISSPYMVTAVRLQAKC